PDPPDLDLQQLPASEPAATGQRGSGPGAPAVDHPGLRRVAPDRGSGKRRWRADLGLPAKALLRVYHFRPSEASATAIAKATGLASATRVSRNRRIGAPPPAQGRTCGGRPLH